MLQTHGESLEQFAARLEHEQSVRDYRASWFVDPYSAANESSAWHYTNSAYRVWATATNN